MVFSTAETLDYRQASAIAIIGTSAMAAHVDATLFSSTVSLLHIVLLTTYTREGFLDFPLLLHGQTCRELHIEIDNKVPSSMRLLT